MNSLKKIVLIGLITALQYQLIADVSHGVLEKYKKNSIFICYGIGSCVNLARALNAGYQEIHGIEDDSVLVNHAQIIFPYDININPFNITNYHIHHGSLLRFNEIIRAINKPMTFFLSSHVPELDEFKVNHILDQLDCIKNHAIKNHTIMIDFVNYSDTEAFGYITLEALQNKLLSINENYCFALEMGGHLEKQLDAILVAYLR